MALKFIKSEYKEETIKNKKSDPNTDELFDKEQLVVDYLEGKIKKEEYFKKLKTLTNSFSVSDLFEIGK